MPVLSPHVMARPAEWPPFEGDPLSVTIYGPPGTAAGAVEVPRAGRYEVWVQGRFDRALSVDVAGRRVGKAGPRELGPAGQAFRIGALDLPPGRTRIVVTRPDNDLAPGDAGTSRLLGPRDPPAGGRRPARGGGGAGRLPAPLRPAARLGRGRTVTAMRIPLAIAAALAIVLVGAAVITLSQRAPRLTGQQRDGRAQRDVGRRARAAGEFAARTASTCPRAPARLRLF